MVGVIGGSVKDFAIDEAGHHRFDGHRAAVQSALGEDAFGSAWSQGRTLSWSVLMAEVAALSESTAAKT